MSTDQPLVRIRAAEALWSRISQNHKHVLVTGAAGAGKTSLLKVLERSCRAVDRPVAWGAPTALTEGMVVCLDDAHLMSRATLRKLALDAQRVGATVVVAALEGDENDPSWDDALPAADMTSLVLARWDRADVSTFLEHRGSGTWEPAEVEGLTAQTLGLPWLLSAAVETDHPDPASAASVRAAVADRWHALIATDERIALALACGYRLTADPVPPDLQDASHQVFEACVRRLARQGVVTAEGEMPELVAAVILGVASPHQLRGSLRTVVDDLSGVGDDLQAVAARLVSVGLRDPRLVRALELAADGVLPHRPTLAAQRYGLAASVAAEPMPLRVRQAEALALSGEVGAAASLLAEQNVELSADHPSMSAAAVCAHIALLSGRVDYAASLWRWRLARLGDGASPERRDGEGALALYGLGEVDGGDVLLDANRGLRPDLTFDGLGTAIDSLRRSLGNGTETQSSAAVAGMVRAAQGAATQHSRRLQPDHPAALAGIAAISWGDLSTAESVLRAAPTDVGAAPDRSRVAAVRAWTAMAAGRFGEATQWASSIDPRIHRDRVWRAALDVGIARRQDDLGALTRLWVESRSALVSAAPDLFAILPLGELAIVAARMREPELARPVLTRVAEILGDVGEHSLWSAPYHWAGIQIAILADEPKALAPHASALMAMAHQSTVAEALVGAARAWVGVLGRDVDVERVTSASRRLGEIGLAWDGARLAGHGAARAASRREAAALLDVARDLRPAPESHGMPASAGMSEAAHSMAGQRAGLVDLTRREREVVELVLSGMTYREIGERLFLSPKTVEHHMARIRRRSGATTRGELLRRLNATLALVPPFLGSD